MFFKIEKKARLTEIKSCGGFQGQESREAGSCPKGTNFPL